ncbi:hypothetical protein FIBSPDRAFT_842053 [Athelia psychrophila]|uniref:Integral membrane protein n=1 Tax=Athelia psychrophila TaxID=1759441 RepID=A0A167WVD3_9AGAM|nr:hypothetical protein FIBSPDRAFT_842053 [Fibularhizoctonia sp. CBS 109695]
MPLAFLLICVSLAQACVAPAVSDATTNSASPFLHTAFSFASSNSTSDICKDIDNCRTLVGIITSCLATIFACVWVAVHPNIPGPKQSWISRQIESAKVVIVTLLVPEWVLAWAVRQFLQARQYAKILEDASCHPHRLRLAEWTTAHGFLAIMGGFYYYQNGKTMFPLQVQDVGERERPDKDYYILALVKSRSLVPPSSDELGDKSKGDTISKSIAIFQTLWFVVQCIARRIENLATTNLEIMTLAYTVITVAMYAAWWHKPLNVHCPIRVKGSKKFAKDTRPFQWTDIINYVTGDQDYLIDLSGEERVPTFWSSCSGGNSTEVPLYADMIALAVAMVFGAVHCAAWSYTFPSLVERWMWRVCAIAIAAIPLPMAGAFMVFNPIDREASGFLDYIIGLCMALGALLYILARIILLILSFTTLHKLPPSAYQAVQWTTWIPHI